MPGARLNEIVTDGNWPWWLTASAVIRGAKWVKVLSLTSCPVFRAHVDQVERLGALPELRRNFHHDVVLIQRREHGGHLALAERVVQRIVDSLLRESQARTGVAIDDDVGLEAAVLLVAADVCENFNGAQFLEDLWRPFVQLFEVVALDRETGIERCCLCRRFANPEPLADTD